MSLYEGLRRAVAEQLAAYLLKQRWFGGKARQIRSTELIDLVPVQAGELFEEPAMEEQRVAKAIVVATNTDWRPSRLFDEAPDI